MDGLVLHFNEAEGRGIVRAGDGSRFEFSGDDWKSPEPPAEGLPVDFVAAEGRAADITLCAGLPPRRLRAAARSPPPISGPGRASPGRERCC